MCVLYSIVVIEIKKEIYSSVILSYLQSTLFINLSQLKSIVLFASNLIHVLNSVINNIKRKY